MNELDGLTVLASDLDHPEGIALGPDGALYAGGEAGQVYRIDSQDGSTEQIADTGGFLLGICLDAEGGIYVCDTDADAVLRIDATGRAEPYCQAASGAPLRTPNWAAFDADGALWLTDSGTESVSACDGTLVRIAPGGGDGEVIDLPPLHFPNGLCVGADGSICILESFTPRLSALRDGALEVVAELPGVVPDGLAAEAGGGFIVACYYPFQVLRVDEEGTVDVFLEDPLGQTLVSPTNAVHFGPDLERLAFASLLGWSITACSAPASGMGLHYG